MSQSIDFYKNLPTHNRFIDIANPQYFQPAPEDWMVVVTDVVGSTKAIEAGRHKEVNIAGILSIVALMNNYQDIEYPFAFGGDGATFLLPTSSMSQIKDVLAETRHMCQETFGLNLRVGFVSAKEVYAAGHTLQVGRFQSSPYYAQAVLIGSGFDYAEALIKTEPTNAPYLLPSEYQAPQKANYTGLVCPFQNIQNSKEETISLIIKLTSMDTAQQREILNQILQHFDTIFGDKLNYHPLANEIHPKMALSSQTYNMVSIHAQQKGGIKFYLFWLMHKFLHFIIHLSVKLTPKSFVRDADFRKFDGSLKMIMACSTADRLKLERFLAELHQQGLLFYGLHVSDKAIVTCLTEFSTMKGVHFVDGADGGYAFAARSLKKQIAVQHLVNGISPKKITQMGDDNPA